MSTTITECAVSAAPSATSEITAALKSALSDKGSSEPVGKSSGKGKYVEPEPEPEPSGFDFGRAPLDVRGIYLLAPSPGGGIQLVQRDVVRIVKEVRREVVRVPFP